MVKKSCHVKVEFTKCLPVRRVRWGAKKEVVPLSVGGVGGKAWAEEAVPGAVWPAKVKGAAWVGGAAVKEGRKMPPSQL